MTRSYQDITTKHRAKLDPSSKEHAEVFEQAYRKWAWPSRPDTTLIGTPAATSSEA